MKFCELKVAMVGLRIVDSESPRRVNTLAFLGYASPLLSLPQPVKHVQFPVLTVPFSLPSTPALLTPECVNLLLDDFRRALPLGLLKYIFYYKSF